MYILYICIYIYYIYIYIEQIIQITRKYNGRCLVFIFLSVLCHSFDERTALFLRQAHNARGGAMRDEVILDTSCMNNLAHTRASIFLLLAFLRSLSVVLGCQTMDIPALPVTVVSPSWWGPTTPTTRFNFLLSGVTSGLVACARAGFERRRKSATPSV